MISRALGMMIRARSEYQTQFDKLTQNIEETRFKVPSTLPHVAITYQNGTPIDLLQTLSNV